MKCHIICRFNLIYNRDKYLLWNILSEDLIPHTIEQNQKYTLSMVIWEQWRHTFTRARRTERPSFYLRAGKKISDIIQCNVQQAAKKYLLISNSVFFGSTESLRTTLMQSLWDEDMETPNRTMVVQSIQLISNVQPPLQLHSFHKLAK